MKRKIAVVGLGIVIVAIVAFAGVLIFAGAPAIPHSLQGRADCIGCHGSAGVRPYPKFHAEERFGNGRCTECHEVATTDARD